ncbi:MAG: PHP domain-containing protein [Candidatus Zipacnadales bacterium]
MSSEANPPFVPRNAFAARLMPDLSEERLFATEEPRSRVLEQAAETIGPVPTLPKQGGADIIYCPEYRPQLYPERNLAEQCSQSLLTSPLLAQGEKGRNPFRVAWDQVARMDRSDSELAKRLLIAGAHYWLNRDSTEALDTAVASLLVEESTSLKGLMIDAAGPTLLKLLPPELSGLPPPEELGAAYDIRVATTASFNSIAHLEQVLHTASKRGLNGIAITDLDHLDAIREARRIAERLKKQGSLPEDFLVIAGEEITSLSGPVIGLFLEDRIQRGMTLKATIDAIHRQGGVAILADPGTGSGTKFVRTMEVDGYLLRSHPASMFRTLSLLDHTGTGVRPLLAGSGARSAGAVGIPYSVAETQSRKPEAIRQAFREHMTFGATSVQMPILAVMVFRPLARFATVMSWWFHARDRVEMTVEKLIGSDNVEIRTSYDKDIANLLGIMEAPRVIGDLIDGHSSLNRAPRLRRISADYGHIRLEYRWEDHVVALQGAVQW